MAHEINRRSFAGHAAAAGAFTIVPRHVLGGAAFVPPSDKLTLAHVGMGTQSFRELRSLLEDPRIQIVTVCDPNKDSNDYVEWGKGGIKKQIRSIIGKPNWRSAEGGCPGGRDVGCEVINTYYANQRGAEKFRAVSTYADYREMFDKESDIDAVKVMTPDHLHATISIAAFKKGIHVVMHKPVANRMHEARLTIETQRRTQTESHLLAYGSGVANGEIAKRIKDGVIGNLREIHNWSNRPVWPQYSEIPTDHPPVPEGLDWDLWLGPAVYRPFHPHYTHTVFRGWYDFGGGSMADMGIYSLWPIFTTLGLESAKSAEAWASHFCKIVDGVSRPARNDFAYPLACRLHFTFDATGGAPPLELFWYDGGMKPRLPKQLLAAGIEIQREGILFVGESGMIYAEFRGADPILFNKSGNKPLWDHENPPYQRADSLSLWVEAFRGGKPSPGSFLNAGPISDTINLGTVALRAGQPVEFDSKAMQITNDPDANQYLRREYRPGWELA